MAVCHRLFFVHFLCQHSHAFIALATAPTPLLFCLVDEEATSNAFPVEIESTKTFGDPKKLINTERLLDFGDVAAVDLTDWRVSIPDDATTTLINPSCSSKVSERKKLKATTKLSKVFDTELPEETIHIVQQPSPCIAACFGFRDILRMNLSISLTLLHTSNCTDIAHAHVPARVSTPLSGYISDQFRPGTHYLVSAIALPILPFVCIPL